MLQLGFQTNHSYFKYCLLVTSTSHFVSVSTALLSQISLLQKYGKPFIGDSSCIKRSTHSGGAMQYFRHDFGSVVTGSNSTLLQIHRTSTLGQI
jgi:hypothetical protein